MGDQIPGPIKGQAQHARPPIFEFQRLSEDFIKEFQDRVDWGFISYHQNLSKEFCIEFYERVDWNMLDRKSKLYKGFFTDAPNYVKLYITLNYRELIKYL